ncbi:hypothetical protein [Pseudogemmobacter bohemicus]|uniref:hypothetical protein n=1 Tax=Pseudogemmobacter bohemicus TaxID=2250708 RepID=UPI000DD44623|nr:hypothetical protein [Pseudogemmobacter bohemicus]
MIYLHIGVHKTGTTTLQAFLEQRGDRLRDQGLHLFQGSIIASNHIELYLSCLDEGRDSLALQSLKIGSLEALQQRTLPLVADHIRKAHDAGDHALFTSEGLSLLRSPAELARLRVMLGGGAVPITVICALRDREDYLEAYRKQILKVPGRKPSADPKSSLYVEPDSWLADFQALLRIYGETFGREAIRVVDYDAETARSGDVLQALLRAMDLPETLIPAPNTIRRQNTSSWWNRIRQSGVRLAHNVGLR